MTDAQVGIVGHKHKILPAAIKKGETIISASLLTMQVRWQMQNYRGVKRKDSFLASLSIPSFQQSQANK